MTNLVVEQRLRNFMLVLAALLCLGTPVELWLTEHTGSTAQLIPFILCGIGLIASGAVLFWPRRGTVLALRIAMGLVMLGSAFGVFEHLEHNIEFALEIQPNAVVGDVFFEALRGANPLLAPGILAVAAIIALAATYYHPVLGRRADIEMAN